jgi:hypothetical protein
MQCSKKLNIVKWRKFQKNYTKSLLYAGFINLSYI